MILARQSGPRPVSNRGHRGPFCPSAPCRPGTASVFHRPRRDSGPAALVRSGGHVCAVRFPRASADGRAHAEGDRDPTPRPTEFLAQASEFSSPREAAASGSRAYPLTDLLRRRSQPNRKHCPLPLHDGVGAPDEESGRLSPAAPAPACDCRQWIRLTSAGGRLRRQRAKCPCRYHPGR